MSLEGLDTVTVTGQIARPDGKGWSNAYVTFTAPTVVTTDGARVLGGATRVALPPNGHFSVDLLATDAGGIDPTGWTYEVKAYLTGTQPTWTRHVSLPKATPSVHLGEIITADPVEGVQGVPLVINTTGAASYDELPKGLGPSDRAALLLGSSFDGGEDDGTGTDSTARLNLYSYQRASTYSYGENIRHFLMRGNAKSMDAWYFPDGGYDEDLEPVGTFKPVVWTGAHWQANDGQSNHKHWSVETPDTTGAIQTRFEIRWGDPQVTDAIGGLDKTLVMTNLADFVVRCSNGQELRLAAPAGTEKGMTFSHDALGGDSYRRWKIRTTGETESGGGAGSNFQIVRYDDTGTFVDNPLVISRSTGNVTLGPGFVARRASASVSSLSLNTSSLGGGVGVVALANANTAPAGTPSGGGVLYAENGALKWKGSNGTVTTLGAA
ncbi:hypothetical protein ACFUZA_00220 [Streptomyces cellulosae]|uniref:hypothetical protein n=1 Tax=Streptomyces cellulosae TaxID=1968 RepID=UPI0036764D64